MSIDPYHEIIRAQYGRIAYRSIATGPQRQAPPAMLLRASVRAGGQGRTRTRANWTSWAPDRIDALRRALQGEFDGLRGDLPPTCGPMVAGLGVWTQLADRLGLTRVLGKERLATRALVLVLGRVAAQGSRLSAVRWAAHHAVAERRGLGRGDEDDLEAALEALAPRQAQIEAPREHLVRRQTGPSPTVVRDDVTASSVAGEGHALAALGDHRDQQPGQAPSVIGLMTMANGEPVAVHVFEGHTAAPRPVPAQVETLRTRGGSTAVVCLGARGMVTTTGKAARASAGDQDITALTTPQGRQLWRAGR
jgi:hypothetical protein